MSKNRKQAVELKLEGKFGNYEAWTSANYSEVRGTKGIVVKRFRGATSSVEAVLTAEDLAAVLATV